MKREFERAVYEEFKVYIDSIGRAEDMDISVSTSMFISNIERGGTYKYDQEFDINKEEIAKRFNEIREELK